MKKNFIYALIACFTLSLAACSTDPEDATSKHVYGENENPYLKTNADAVVSTKAEFPISRLEAKTVKLTDYAEKFHTSLGMTVDETLAALSNGLMPEQQATAVFFSTEVVRCAVLHRKNLHNIFQNPAGSNMMQMKSGQRFWKLPGRLLQM